MIRSRPSDARKEQVDALKEKVRAIKGRLPKDYRKRLVAAYPEYDNIVGNDFLANVVRLRTTDARLTEILEQIVRESEANQAEKELKGDAESKDAAA